jgi:hypothetical protein
MAKKQATRPKKTPLDPAEQSARFVEAARRVGADERPEEFDRMFKAVVSKKNSKNNVR